MPCHDSLIFPLVHFSDQSRALWLRSGDVNWKGQQWFLMYAPRFHILVLPNACSCFLKFDWPMSSTHIVDCFAFVSWLFPYIFIISHNFISWFFLIVQIIVVSQCNSIYWRRFLYAKNRLQKSYIIEVLVPQVFSRMNQELLYWKFHQCKMESMHESVHGTSIKLLVLNSIYVLHLEFLQSLCAWMPVSTTPGPYSSRFIKLSLYNSKPSESSKN